MRSEVKASIIKVAGDWALAMTTLSESPEVTTMEIELPKYFNTCYNDILSELGIDDDKEPL